MSKKILVVDDSALVRKQLGGLLERYGYIVDTAKNGRDGVDKALAENYDAITMDINMPELDGLSALKIIMQKNPTPILMVSSLTTEDAPATIEALENGALDCVAKPGTLNLGLEQTEDEIIQKIAEVSKISRRRLARMAGRAVSSPEPSQKMTKASIHAGFKGVVLIGSSTGGPNLIEEICTALPADFPHPVCVVQHMPEKFTAAFATRINRVSKLNAKESEHGDELNAGMIYIAKGGTHMRFSKKVSGKIIIRHEEAQVKRFFKPSVDEMFFSSIDVFNPKDIFAVELTGIGDDGADGMVAIKKAGGYTIAESEETAVVYGMPKEAYLRGGTCEVLPFPKIVQKIVAYR